MGIFDFWKKKEERSETATVEEYHELESEEQVTQVKVVVDRIDSLTSVDRILKQVKSGNVVVAGMKDLKETNLDELKQCVNKLKLYVGNMKGDIAGVGDDWLIVTPASAKIHRE